VRTYWAWETTATLRLLSGARAAWAPSGAGEWRRHIVSPCAQLVKYCDVIFGCSSGIRASFYSASSYWWVILVKAAELKVTLAKKAVNCLEIGKTVEDVKAHLCDNEVSSPASRWNRQVGSSEITQQCGSVFHMFSWKSLRRQYVADRCSCFQANHTCQQSAKWLCRWQQCYFSYSVSVSVIVVIYQLQFQLCNFLIFKLQLT